MRSRLVWIVGVLGFWAPSAPVAAADGLVERVEDAERPVVESSDADVVVIGDSITLDATPHLMRECDVDLEIDWAGARRVAESWAFLGWVPSGLEAMRSGHDPDRWVLALGTTDLQFVDDAGDVRAMVDAVLAEAGDTPVTWINVLHRRDLRRSRMFNRVLSGSGVDVVDWFDHAIDHPEWFADPFHPNRAGLRQLARLVCSPAGSYGVGSEREVVPWSRLR
jgi:hypothetical protein